MGHDKTAIRQNVLDGDNLPNAILNAIIAGYDAPTIINDTVEVLQSGDTTSYMFEATPDAIEQFAETFVEKVKQVAAELRDFEYIDKPIIRRKSREEPKPAQDGLGVTEPKIVDEGIEVESAGEGDLDEGLDINEPEGLDELGAGEPGLDEEPALAAEQTIHKVGVADLEIDAILRTQKPLDSGRFQGRIAIKFPTPLDATGRSSVAGVLALQGVDVDELGQAVAEYTIDFIARNSDKYFDGMDVDTASGTLEFTGMSFSESNSNAIVSTFEVGG